jgi:hypothetical protein
MTHYDHLLPVARLIIKSMSAKPGIHFVDKEMAAQWLAQAMFGKKLSVAPEKEVKA